MDANTNMGEKPRNNEKRKAMIDLLWFYGNWLDYIVFSVGNGTGHVTFSGSIRYNAVLVILVLSGWISISLSTSSGRPVAPGAAFNLMEITASPVPGVFSGFSERINGLRL